MNLGKVEIWETSLDRIVTLREGAKGVLRPERWVHVSFCFFLLSLCGFWGDG